MGGKTERRRMCPRCGQYALAEHTTPLFSDIRRGISPRRRDVTWRGCIGCGYGAPREVREEVFGGRTARRASALPG